jgi:hypothetical protein
VVLLLMGHSTRRKALLQSCRLPGAAPGRYRHKVGCSAWCIAENPLEARNRQAWERVDTSERWRANRRESNPPGSADTTVLFSRSNYTTAHDHAFSYEQFLAGSTQRCSREWPGHASQTKTRAGPHNGERSDGGRTRRRTVNPPGGAGAISHTPLTARPATPCRTGSSASHDDSTRNGPAGKDKAGTNR